MPDVDAKPTLDGELAKLREAAALRTDEERRLRNERFFQELEEKVIRQAINVGEQAPDFVLQAAEGNRRVHLAEELERGPVVLCFYRGQWCPYCNLQLQGVQRHHQEILDLGAQVYFIGPETREDAMKMIDKTEATIPLLYDLDGGVMAAYRIEFTQPEYLRRADAEPWNARTGWRLPVPATFIIDRNGTVAARYSNADYKYRMEPAEIVAVLKTLHG